MDRQRDPYSGRFGESASGSRRPTGSYRTQPSGGYKSRPDYAPNSRPGSRTAPGDSYTRRPEPRAPSSQSRDRKKQRRVKKLRIAALVLALVLIVAGVIFAICAKRNQVVHQMPTIRRTAEFENVTITEET